MPRKEEKIDEQILREISIIIAEYITGSGLDDIFLAKSIHDCSGESTKWKRIYYSLCEKQKQDKCSNNVLVFICAIMNPVRFESSTNYETAINELNIKLTFCGLILRSDGKLARVKSAETISDAEQRASQLMKRLHERGIHSDVIKFCNAELLENNYFHCVLEASKSLAHKIREKAALTSDGAKLVDEAFSVKNPILAFNTLTTESEQSDQKGFANLLKGIFGTFRNSRAHEARIFWAVDLNEALDALTMISYAHRRLDSCVKIP